VHPSGYWCEWEGEEWEEAMTGWENEIKDADIVAGVGRMNKVGGAREGDRGSRGRGGRWGV
jgi:hypothetical protein